MSARLVPEPIAPGQESVWDYPGGWITSTVTGPFKGGPGTEDW